MRNTGDWMSNEEDFSARALVVHDDPELRSALAAILRDDAFDVREAADADEAIDAVLEHEPEVLVVAAKGAAIMARWVRLHRPGITLVRLCDEPCEEGEHVHAAWSLVALLTIIDDVRARSRSRLRVAAKTSPSTSEHAV